MSSVKTFRVNSPTVVYEVFEQEVVIIHLDNGTYYTLNESGAHIWKLLEQGAPISAIITTLVAHSADHDRVADTVNQIIEQLQQEQLIVPVPTPHHNAVSWSLSDHPATQKQTGTFTEPFFKKYTDMQDLLLLDPIHDVEETGWPNAHRQ